MSLTDLPKEDRLKLMSFVCSFAWADLEIQETEREMIRKLVKQLGLEADEVDQVEAWLEVPPMAEEVDPQDIPYEHRQLFLNVALQMVGADGVIDSAEMENLSLLEQLLR
ncbi:MAG: TerB family tellurite resistance protein [Alphaproteobacteria bacterium]|nr:TerB family tellurite resistance protein [Alphaproteobacteria bacterium]